MLPTCKLPINTVAHNKYILVSANIPLTSSMSFSVNPNFFIDNKADSACNSNLKRPIDIGM